MSQTTERVLLADIQKLPEFACLIPAHQTFINVLLTRGYETGTFDFLGATAAAYPKCAGNHASLAVRSSQIQVHPRVKRVLDLAFGREPEKTDPMLEDLKKAIRKSIRRDGGVIAENTLTAIRLYERQSGKKLKVVSRGN
jgi:hypothetical protein